MQALLDIMTSEPGTAELAVVVYGSAKPAGSKKGFRVPGTNHVRITDDNPKSKPWKLQVAQIAGEAMAGRELLEGPLEVSFQFFRPRPKGHIGMKGLNAKGRSMPFPAVKPDVLKLARAVEDALTGVVWRDDAQIVRELLAKEYGEPERVVIVVRRLS
jgi:Holliday junction resolvase RusA-like endonuclease